MKVAEIFGPTIQGEGPSTGRPAVFVRLWGCNLTCEWCDTPYTWDTTRFSESVESTVMSVEEIVAAVKAVAAPGMVVVVTGGEPLMQPETVVLLNLLGCAGFKVEVETNGTIFRDVDPGVRFNVSPKLSSSGVRPGIRLKAPAISRLLRVNSVFKLVVADEDALLEVDEFVASYGVRPDRVWLMPEARTRQELSERLLFVAEAAIRRGYNLSTRLHIDLWGDERGH